MTRAYLVVWMTLALTATAMLIAAWFATPSGAPPSSAVGSHPIPGTRRVGAEGLFTGSTPATRYAAVSVPTFTGNAGWAVPSLGRSYLAVRLPRGTVVTITGPGGSWTTAVTDYGPSSKIVPARVADIAVGQWERICGLSPSAGLCRVSISAGGNDVTPTGPPTDVGP